MAWTSAPAPCHGRGARAVARQHVARRWTSTHERVARRSPLVALRIGGIRRNSSAKLTRPSRRRCEARGVHRSRERRACHRVRAALRGPTVHPLLGLGLVPQAVHLGQRRLRGRAAIGGQQRLDAAEAADEFLVGGRAARPRDRSSGGGRRWRPRTADRRTPPRSPPDLRPRSVAPASATPAATACSSSANSSLSLSNTGASDGQSKPTRAALSCNLTARVSAGSATGTSSSTPGRGALAPSPWP